MKELSPSVISEWNRCASIYGIDVTDLTRAVCCVMTPRNVIAVLDSLRKYNRVAVDARHHWSVLEYNVREFDPSAQIVVPRTIIAVIVYENWLGRADRAIVNWYENEPLLSIFDWRTENGLPFEPVAKPVPQKDERPTVDVNDQLRMHQIKICELSDSIEQALTKSTHNAVGVTTAIEAVARSDARIYKLEQQLRYAAWHAAVQTILLLAFGFVIFHKFFM